MRVTARMVDWNECPENIAPYTKQSQTFLTVDREYDVHAVVVFNGFPSFLIVDDVGYPSWNAHWLFSIVDPTLPHDWICNAFQDEPALLLGPEFLAKDEPSYGAMVELDSDQVDRFWKRVEALDAEKAKTEDE